MKSVVEKTCLSSLYITDCVALEKVECVKMQQRAEWSLLRKAVELVVVGWRRARLMQNRGVLVIIFTRRRRRNVVMQWNIYLLQAYSLSMT